MELASRSNLGSSELRRSGVEHLSEMPLEAYKKASDYLEDREDIIDPSTFKRFSPRLIREDQAKVEAKKKRIAAEDSSYDRDMKRFSDVFEVIFTEQAELSDWLGPETTMRKASEYDDLFHGIDSIAEFSCEGSSGYLALGIDVTSSASGIQKKLEIIKQSIDTGRLTEIRYFQSLFPDGNPKFEGSLFNVPKGIIAVDRSNIAELAHLWVKRDTKTLGSHPIQLHILKQLDMQMTAFIKYAHQKDRGHLIPPLLEVQKRIRAIQDLPTKQKIVQSPNGQAFMRNNRMIRLLQQNLDDLFASPRPTYDTSRRRPMNSANGSFR